MGLGADTIDALTSPYRTSEAPKKDEPIKGLTRYAGCRCEPPGDLYCWWHNIGPKDVWQCEHGSMWVRDYDCWGLQYRK